VKSTQQFILTESPKSLHPENARMSGRHGVQYVAQCVALGRGTVCGTMRSMCDADAGCLAINYQSPSQVSAVAAPSSYVPDFTGVPRP